MRNGEIKAVKVVGSKQAAIVESLAQSIWREYYIPIIGRDQVEYMLEKIQSKKAISGQIEKEGYLYYLLKDGDNDWVGYLAVVVHGQDKELFISKLYINAENRGKGYGKYAIGFIETLALERGLPKISLIVDKNNELSIRIYEKLGFSIAGPCVVDFGAGFVMDDYKMVKAIA